MWHDRQLGIHVVQGHAALVREVEDLVTRIQDLKVSCLLELSFDHDGCLHTRRCPTQAWMAITVLMLS
jgi:hypothetical protein